MFILVLNVKIVYIFLFGDDNYVHDSTLLCDDSSQELQLILIATNLFSKLII